MTQGAENSMNEIDKKQVETRMLNLLRARTLIYRRAKNVQAVGLIISLVFPIVGLIVSALLLPSKPFIAFAALMFSFLEVLLLDRWHRAQLKNAAKLQEDFDCTVLQMDWNTFLVGNRIDPEDVFADACKKLSDEDEQRLINWYPLAVKELLQTRSVDRLRGADRGGWGRITRHRSHHDDLRPLHAGSDDAGDHLGAQGMQPAGRDH